jgi:tRNA A37 threonylcarbamoyladenosine biosynthesis protein TsaE
LSKSYFGGAGMVAPVYEYLRHAQYYAPRGKKRLMMLGSNISQRYLSAEDKIVGLVGDAGAGKSVLIQGMFPGLELTNDDDGINIRPLPLMHDVENNHFRYHSYHIDMRFEAAFTQMWILAEAVQKAVKAHRRVVIEHFELLYPALKKNADILIGIGEEVIVTRPGVFGPEPEEIAERVFASLKLRKMSHTAEDLTVMVLHDMGITKPRIHSDISHGFLMGFQEKPDFDLPMVESKVKQLIQEDLPICYIDDEHIKVGDRLWKCTGPRLHMQSTGDVKDFRLLRKYQWDPVQESYLIAGLTGK